MHPDGETSTAVRNGFDECVMQKCWTYAETSKRQRENKATSLFFGKAPQRMPAEFWGLFFRVIYVYTHTYLYIHIVYTHTHSLILGPAYLSGVDTRVDLYT